MVLNNIYSRYTNVTPSEQLLLTLRFYASGSFQITVVDFAGIHQTTASRIIRKVWAAIKSLYDFYVKHPSTHEEILNSQCKFYNFAKFPRCIGALNCTHVKIMSPGIPLNESCASYIHPILCFGSLLKQFRILLILGGDYAELFRNRKGYFSINVQAVCDADLNFTDVVTRWPGSTHDSTIFNNSRLKYYMTFGSKILIWYHHLKIWSNKTSIIWACREFRNQ